MVVLVVALVAALGRAARGVAAEHESAERCRPGGLPAPSRMKIGQGDDGAQRLPGLWLLTHSTESSMDARLFDAFAPPAVLAGPRIG